MPKTTAAIIVSIAIGLSATSTWAAQPSFDCAKATHDVEKLIGNDAGLAELDQSLAELYATDLKHTPDANKGTLKAEQRGWVKGRNDCWKASDMRGCVAVGPATLHGGVDGVGIRCLGVTAVSGDRSGSHSRWLRRVGRWPAAGRAGSHSCAYEKTNRRWPGGTGFATPSRTVIGASAEVRGSGQNIADGANAPSG